MTFASCCKCESLCNNALEILQEIAAAASLQKKNKNLNFFGLFVTLIMILVIFLSFKKKDTLIQKLFSRLINFNLGINSYYTLSEV